MGRKLFFGLVKAVIVVFLLLKPHHAAKAHKVWHDTYISPAKEPVVEPVQKVEEPAYREMVANVSAYTSSDDECGKGDGVTASGRRATAGRTIAMDGVPFGTKVEINGHIYTVEDRFGGGYTNRIDIYMNSKKEAFRFGRQRILVKIWR